MGLKYPGEWKFEGIDVEIPSEAVSKLLEVILKTADGSQSLVESFKYCFGGVGTSSNYDWAVSDFLRIARASSNNAAVFVDGVWKCIEHARSEEVPVPTANAINKLLREHDVPLAVEPPELRRTDGDSMIAEAGSPASEPDSRGPIPTYVLHNELGQGGYGIVYRATRTTAVGEFEYAVKVLDPSPFVQNYEKAVQRFKREVSALRSLQHRAIVQYFDAGIDVNKKPYVVMPLVDGRDLRDACSGRPVVVLIDVFIEVTGGLCYAHESDVLHRDLKPSNIRVRSTDLQPVILDFGSAYLLDQMDSNTLTTAAVGTIGYIPSEVLADPKIRSPLHDVYACGVMLYEAAVGRRPDPANYVTLASQRADCECLDAIIQQAIAGAATRTRSMKELQGQLIAAREAAQQTVSG